MWKLFPLFTIAFWNIAVANDDSVREVYYQGLVAPLSITPTFDKGYLIGLRRDRRVPAGWVADVQSCATRSEYSGQCPRRAVVLIVVSQPV